MRRSCSLLVTLVIVSALAPALLAQSKAKAENVPELPYDSVADFLKLPPNVYLGEGIGVATKLPFLSNSNSRVSPLLV